MKMALFKGANRLLTCLFGSTSLTFSFAPPCSTLLHLPNMQRNATFLVAASDSIRGSTAATYAGSCIRPCFLKFHCRKKFVSRRSEIELLQKACKGLGDWPAPPPLSQEEEELKEEEEEEKEESVKTKLLLTLVISGQVVPWSNLYNRSFRPD